jgi:hypothetical protein
MASLRGATALSLLRACFRPRTNLPCTPRPANGQPLSLGSCRLPLASRSAVSTRGGVSTIVAQQKRDGGESLGDYTERLNLANTAFSLGSMARRAAVPAMPAGLALSQFVLPIQEAAAKGGEYGLVEGKAFALIHPLVSPSPAAPAPGLLDPRAQPDERDRKTVFVGLF